MFSVALKNFKTGNFNKTLFCSAQILSLAFGSLNVSAEVTKVSSVDQDQSVFAVTDDELKNYSNTSDLIREIKILRKDKAALLDYSKKLREKFKEYEKYYAGQSGSSLPSEVNTTELDIVKQENSKLNQDIQNLKTEYDALKLQEAGTKQDFATYKQEAEQKLALYNEVKSGYEQKKSESSACLEQLDKSKKLVLQIPDLEKEIVGLKNELLMKKSAAELFAHGQGATPVVNSPTAVAQKAVSFKNAAVVQPEMNSDMMIVEVVADKVSLRAGPGLTNSALMDIAKGARLTVEAREGEWLRVNSPTGGRAYVLKKFVRTIDSGSRADQSVQLARANQKEKLKEDFVPLEVEPVKPPLPQKPVKRVVNSRAQFNQQVDSGMSQETMALEALKKAMSKKVEDNETAGE